MSVSLHLTILSIHLLLRINASKYTQNRYCSTLIADLLSFFNRKHRPYEVFVDEKNVPYLLSLYLYVLLQTIKRTVCHEILYVGI